MGNGESLWRRIQTKFQRRPEVRVLMIGELVTPHANPAYHPVLVRLGSPILYLHFNLACSCNT